MHTPTDIQRSILLILLTCIECFPNDYKTIEVKTEENVTQWVDLPSDAKLSIVARYMEGLRRIHEPSQHKQADDLDKTNPLLTLAILFHAMEPLGAEDIGFLVRSCPAFIGDSLQPFTEKFKGIEKRFAYALRSYPTSADGIAYATQKEEEYNRIFASRPYLAGQKFQFSGFNFTYVDYKKPEPTVYVPYFLNNKRFIDEHVNPEIPLFLLSYIRSERDDLRMSEDHFSAEEMEQRKQQIQQWHATFIENGYIHPFCFYKKSLPYTHYFYAYDMLKCDIPFEIYIEKYRSYLTPAVCDEMLCHYLLGKKFYELRAFMCIMSLSYKDIENAYTVARTTMDKSTQKYYYTGYWSTYYDDFCKKLIDTFSLKKIGNMNIIGMGAEEKTLLEQKIYDKEKEVAAWQQEAESFLQKLQLSEIQ